MKIKSLTIVLLISLCFIYSCNKHDQEYKYYDFKGNRISETEFSSNGGNGIVKVYFMGENGIKLVDEVEYRNDKPNGKWIRWNDSRGYKSTEGEYKDGLKHGKEIWWDENGKRQSVICYKNDEIDGKWIGYYPNGKKYDEIDYKNGKIHGKYICWDDRGAVIIEEIYNEGKLVKKLK